MLRAPESLVDLTTVLAYFSGESAKAWDKGEHVILEFQSDTEPGDW